jgi:hypothetical protein
VHDTTLTKGCRSREGADPVGARRYSRHQ